jgi:hypothetical protein
MLQIWLPLAQDQLKTTTDAQHGFRQPHVTCPVLSRSLGEKAETHLATLLPQSVHVSLSVQAIVEIQRDHPRSHLVCRLLQGIVQQGTVCKRIAMCTI